MLNICIIRVDCDTLNPHKRINFKVYNNLLYSENVHYQQINRPASHGSSSLIYADDV